MINDKRVVCLIPARGGSKGIPKKNLIDLGGQPLISHSIQHALGSKYIDAVYLSSDSDEILQTAEKYNATPIRRSAKLSDDYAALEDLVKNFLTIVQNIDIMVMLQPTSPLRSSEDIDNAIEELFEQDVDSLFSAVELEDFFIWERNESGKLQSVNYDFENRQRRQDINGQFVENGSIYVFKPSVVLENNNRLGGKIGVSIMESWKIHEIDSYDDLEMCRFIYNKKVLNE
jgi:N-acylneuraminate cytidylyltransferase|tara:strand:+ start:1939 stop:2628 length:690 start_codon:yes stop_codon:yes gene_type:complete